MNIEVEKFSWSDIEKICTSLIKYFSQKVTPLGYRLNIEIAGHLNATVVQKYTFKRAHRKDRPAGE